MRIISMVLSPNSFPRVPLPWFNLCIPWVTVYFPVLALSKLLPVLVFWADHVPSVPPQSRCWAVRWQLLICCNWAIRECRRMLWLTVYSPYSENQIFELPTLWQTLGVYTQTHTRIRCLSCAQFYAPFHHWYFPLFVPIYLSFHRLIHLIISK